MSDSFLYLMAREHTWVDGRPLRVFTIADFDSAGWQMPVRVGRKLQALRALHFPDLDFEVRAVALQPQQVRDLKLPPTPRKDRDLHGRKWRERWGHEQTEVDALATLQPEMLETLLCEALEPFFDASFEPRLLVAKNAWETEAQRRLDKHIDQKQLARLRKETQKVFKTLTERQEGLNARIRDLTRGVELPPIEVPRPRFKTAPGQPLISSAWPWLTQTQALKKRKAYE